MFDVVADGYLIGADQDQGSLLDRAVNNTSVMFLLQVGDALLLFPGDAQWGAWQPLLDDAEGTSP